MQLEILQENLNHALTLASRILVSKPQIPILANILLVAKNGKLTLTASNLETSIILEIGAKVLSEGDFTVPGRTLTEIVSSLSAEKIQLEVVEGSIVIKSGSFNARINGIASAEYPKLSPDDVLGQDNYWEIDRQEFLEGLGMTTFAAASDEGRAVLTGVLLRPKDKGLILASTDGFRLSVVELDRAVPSKKEVPPSIIIPARTLTELTRILGEKTPDKESKTIKIFISRTDNQVFFDLGEIKIFSRLVTGNFPDYEKIIPSKSNLKVTTTVEELSKAVRLASIFARDSANIVKLKIINSKLLVSANAAQVGENESTVDVTLDGENKNEELTIAFNYRYLLDLLAVASGEVVMEFSGQVSPGVFHCSGAKNFLHIIMPVRVQS